MYYVSAHHDVYIYVSIYQYYVHIYVCNTYTYYHSSHYCIDFDWESPPAIAWLSHLKFHQPVGIRIADNLMRAWPGEINGRAMAAVAAGAGDTRYRAFPLVRCNLRFPPLTEAE